MRSTVNPVLSGHSKRRPKIVFQDQLPLNAGQKYCRMLPLEHSAILLICIKLPFVIKICVLSTFDRPLKTRIIVLKCRLFVYFVALRPKSTAMVIAGRSVHLTTLFPGQT